MQISGTITKLNDELKYGFIKVPKLGDVFFSEESKFTEGLIFDGLKVGQKLQIEMIKTERGMFAKTLSPGKAKRPLKRPETSL
jgi:cold shock CspA family protein